MNQQSTDFFINPVIKLKCWKLYSDGYYNEAALNAMIEVERTLKNKNPKYKEKTGTNLINLLFKKDSDFNITPYFDAEQKQFCQKYFIGAFSYYRNYSAHGGHHLDKRAAFRCLIIASELLDLLMPENAAINPLLFIDEAKIKDIETLRTVLTIFGDYTTLEGTYDGLTEDLIKHGCSEFSFEELLKNSLIEIEYFHCSETKEPMDRFTLTERGSNLLASI